MAAFHSGTGFDLTRPMNEQPSRFGYAIEALLYPFLLLVLLWLIYWADAIFYEVDFYKFGVKPQTSEGLKGILLMPLIHSPKEITHIINNSFPTYVLLATLIYYYRSIALRVFVLMWVLTGLGLWAFSIDNHSYHIGISGIIYSLAGFLLTSGFLRSYKPLQAISLFVTFIYGSMIWGIFPMEPQVSWQGHLSGLLVGVVLAFYYRKEGPQAPKYQYEIEKEMGIEPPDPEGDLRRAAAEEEARQQNPYQIIYHYKPKKSDQEP